MRPVVVIVGPLATAVANNISTSQTPAVASGLLALNGTLGSGAFAGTGSISGNVLTITAVSAGVLSAGATVSGAGVFYGMTVVAPLTGTGGTGTYVVSVAQTLSSTTIYGDRIATLDLPRRVLFTTVSDESGKTITVYGKDVNGSLISEALTGPNATTGYTVLDYKIVIGIKVSAAFTGAVTVGTNGVASSPWVRMDDFAMSQIGIQCTASGTVNYTLQQTLDDPNSATNPVAPASITWVSSSDTGAVGATASIQTNYAYCPTFARVLLNSGTGSVTTTFNQALSAVF